MKAEQIHISHFNFLTIETLEIDRAVGEHASARLRGTVRDEDAEEYRYLLSAPIWVKIEAEDEDSTRQILLVGMIAGFSLEEMQHEYVLELELKSGTYLMDGREHFRSFQNQSLTYLDVMKMINAPYGESGVIAEDSVEAPVDFLLQYKETDWEFIKRIASRFGLAVTPEIKREGPFYYVGSQYYEEHTLPASAKCRISRYVGAFMQHGANGEGAPREQDYVEYQISTRQIYNLWDLVRMENLAGHIYRIHSAYCKGELIHTYFLRQRQAFKALPIFNECQQGCSFQAEVKAVKQDKVQVFLKGDENADQTITRWFPYSTGYSSPDGAGWYCMPESGDRVRLQIPDQAEEHSYVISAVHLETGHDRRIPDHKSFKTKYGKELLFTPDSLELTNHQGMSVRIIDGQGIQLVSDKDISIIAGGNMMISSEDASLTIAGTSSVDIRQGSAGLHMDNDITFSGGKFRIQ